MKMMKDFQISVIIPCFNEEQNIADTLSFINQQSLGVAVETIVVDGGSTDQTLAIAARSSARILKSPRKGRAAQLNFGAQHARATLLFFLHADSKPPIGFLQYLINTADRGWDAACFRLKFDDSHWFLRANAWFTRFNVNSFRFGDQGLLVRKPYFEAIGGYREELIVLEDQDIVRRLRRSGARFKVLSKPMMTSARKYRQNGIFKLQWTFFLIWLNFRLGRSQKELVALYKRRIKDQKIDVNDVRRKPTDDLHQKPGEGEGKNALGQRPG